MYQHSGQGSNNCTHIETNLKVLSLLLVFLHEERYVVLQIIFQQYCLQIICKYTDLNSDVTK